MARKREFRAYIRQQNPTTGKWENADLSERDQVSDEDFRIFIIDLLVRAGALVGVKEQLEADDDFNEASKTP